MGDAVEKERLDALAAVFNEENDGMKREDYAAGTWGCHEAMFAAHMLADDVTRKLVDHPAVLLRPEWHRRAYRIFEALEDLGRSITREHLGRDQPVN